MAKRAAEIEDRRIVAKRIFDALCAARADGRTKHRGDDPERLDGLAKAIDNGHASKSLGGLHG